MSNDLTELYKEIILDHYRNPRNIGHLEPPAVKAEGTNPMCGDEITLYLDFTDNYIASIKMSLVGCSISQASASMMSKHVIGMDAGEARIAIDKLKTMMDIHTTDPQNGATTMMDRHAHSMGELDSLKGVVKFPSRIKCATMCWITLGQALDEVEGAAG